MISNEEKETINIFYLHFMESKSEFSLKSSKSTFTISTTLPLCERITKKNNNNGNSGNCHMVLHEESLFKSNEQQQ